MKYLLILLLGLLSVSCVHPRYLQQASDFKESRLREQCVIRVVKAGLSDEKSVEFCEGNYEKYY